MRAYCKAAPGHAHHVPCPTQDDRQEAQRCQHQHNADVKGCAQRALLALGFGRLCNKKHMAQVGQTGSTEVSAPARCRRQACAPSALCSRLASDASSSKSTWHSRANRKHSVVSTSETKPPSLRTQRAYAWLPSLHQYTWRRRVSTIMIMIMTMCIIIIRQN